MSYQNKYNTRNSGRYNTPGQFVPAAETQQLQQIPSLVQQQQQQQQQPPPPPPQYQQPPKQQMQQQNQNVFQTNKNLQPLDADIKTECDEEPPKPHWMKPKLAGVKKVSNRERRRRQNENLRRLLTPKNALMVLNEMMPNDQLTNQFTVEPNPTPCGPGYYGGGKFGGQHSFCADLTLDGHNYKGYGENKLSARNAAAEQAIRDLIIKKISKLTSQAANNGNEQQSEELGEQDEEPLPMIQLASFALHKLFSEWEYEGHKVPQLKPIPVGAGEEGSTSRRVRPPGGAGGAGGGKTRPLPVNAASLHPCMLLTHMRPHAEYRDLQAEGTTPQNTIFTMGVHVDNHTYVGKASNKKEARRAAARSACEALFGITFEPTPSASIPIHT